MSEEKLTPEMILQCVETIRYMSDDKELAHIEEDKLHQNILLLISLGKLDDPAGCAKAALKTLEIPFTRWYA